MCGWGAHSSTWGSDCVEVDLPGCSIFLSHSWIPERQKILVVSQVTVDYSRVALISWGTWPWRGTLMWCPCRGYLWHENEFNCWRLMTIMLRVWFFTAVCPHVGTEHHHTAKSLKFLTDLQQIAWMWTLPSLMSMTSKTLTYFSLFWIRSTMLIVPQERRNSGFRCQG